MGTERHDAIAHYNAHRMLAPALQRKMNLLALVAMLLLLALPTAGRVLAGSSSDDGVWAQMCTMAGLKLVKISAGDASPVDSGTPAKSPDAAMAGEDCAYCPVLGGMAILLFCLLFAAPPASRGGIAAWRMFAPRRFAYPSGLGSRGPPLAL